MKVIPKKTEAPLEGVHLWLLLWKASKALEIEARHSVQKIGLGLSDFGVLEALLHKGPLPVNALREKVLLSSGSMTAAVDRLERNGLVERVSTPADRRARIVHLTEKGRNLIEKSFKKHTRDMERAFSVLNGTQREYFAALLRKVGRGPESPLANGSPAATKKGRS